MASLPLPFGAVNLGVPGFLAVVTLRVAVIWLTAALLLASTISVSSGGENVAKRCGS